MSMFHSLHISGSALTAQRLRMDVVSSNIANAQTTRATVNEDGEYEPYRRKMVRFSSREDNFRSYLNRAKNRENTNGGAGVRVTDILEDEEPFQMIYNPDHPDANDDGYVEFPNVNPLKEMVDLMSASRSYEANVTALNATKRIFMKTLEIGQ